MKSRYKKGETVLIKQETVDWHIENNNRDHVDSMDETIGEEGIIMDIYDRPRALVIKVRGQRKTWEYSERCVERIKPSITPFGKLINEIYIKEKRK